MYFACCCACNKSVITLYLKVYRCLLFTHIWTLLKSFRCSGPLLCSPFMPHKWALSFMLMWGICYIILTAVVQILMVCQWEPHCFISQILVWSDLCFMYHVMRRLQRCTVPWYTTQFTFLTRYILMWIEYHLMVQYTSEDERQNMRSL